MLPWQQIYNPLGNLWLSALVAAIPIIFFFVALAVFRLKGYIASTITVALALLVSIFFYNMPVGMALASATYGFLFGLWPIAWILVTAVFLYKVTVETGQFEIIRSSVISVTEDQRLQMLLVGFSFGAFLEGAAGFGAPVAITAALLVGLEFNPLYAAGLCLITNTAPVAFGAMGIPIIVAGQVTGIDPFKIGVMAGRQLPLLSIIIPFWVIIIMDGWRGVRKTWPAILVCGVSFAGTQFLTSNFVGPELPDITSALVSLISVTIFLKFWKPKNIYRFPGREVRVKVASHSFIQVLKAWSPFAILTLFVTVWSLKPFKALFAKGGGFGMDSHQHSDADARQSGDKSAAYRQFTQPLPRGIFLQLAGSHRHGDFSLRHCDRAGSAHESSGGDQDLRQYPFRLEVAGFFNRHGVGFRLCRQLLRPVCHIGLAAGGNGSRFPVFLAFPGMDRSVSHRVGHILERAVLQSPS